MFHEPSLLLAPPQTNPTSCNGSWSGPPSSRAASSRETVDEPTWERQVAPRSQGPVLIAAAGVTHAGSVRRKNEDAYVVRSELGLVVVADGMGGKPAGEVASRLSADEVTFAVERAVETARSRGSAASLAVRTDEAVSLICAAFGQANATIRAIGAADARRRGMATTLAALWFVGDRAIIAHAGDSRVYRIRAGRAEALTEDHSMRALYLRVYGDRADPELARKNAHVITRSVGTQPDLRPDIRVEPVLAGDRFLVCSDGLWGVVDDTEIGLIVSSTPSFEQALVQLVRTVASRGAPDNVTIALARLR